jgi:mono/diheme cytochrome c family protein
MRVLRSVRILTVAGGCAAASIAGLGAGLPVVPAVHALLWHTNRDVVRGRMLFHEKGCEQCHGANAAGVVDRGPSLLTVGKRMSRTAIARQIHDGGQSMPAFGDSLQPEEIDSLVKMLAKMKKVPKGMVVAVPAAGSGKN